MNICPSCNGRKRSWCHLNYGPGKGGEWKWVDCHLCGGTGEISEELQDRVNYGQHIADDRKARLKTLREEAAELGCDAVELSHVEHGRADKATIDKVSSLRIQKRLVSHAREIVAKQREKREQP